MSVTQSWQHCGTAEFTARWGPTTAVIAADGELDAANADLLAEFVHDASAQRKRLILDLRGLKFIGTAGFSALHRINVACLDAAADWSMIPSAAVARLLQICDPDGALPITGPISDEDGFDGSLTATGRGVGSAT